MDFGAFCELEKGLSTLLHSSELSWTKKNISAKKMFKVGDEIDCVITEIDKEKRRVAISHRLTTDNPFETFENTYPIGSEVEGEVASKNEYSNVGGPNRTTYCSSKFAIEGFTKSLAIELGPEGIRVNAVCPTFIQTPMTEPFLKDEDFKKATIGMIPLGRLGEVTDLMGPFVFLASEASSLMTGSSMLVDGGWTAR